MRRLSQIACLISGAERGQRGSDSGTSVATRDMTKDQTNSSRADALRNRERVLSAADRPTAWHIPAGNARGTSRRRRGFQGRPSIATSRKPRGTPRARLLSPGHQHDPPRTEDETAAAGTSWKGSLSRPRRDPGFRRRAPGPVARAASSRGATVAGVPVALRTRHRGTHLLHIAGPRDWGADPVPARRRPRARREVSPISAITWDSIRDADLPPVASGPRDRRDDRLGHPCILDGIARQAAAAITLADRYTERSPRRAAKAAEGRGRSSRASFPPDLRVTGGEVAETCCPATRWPVTGST